MLDPCHSTGTVSQSVTAPVVDVVVSVVVVVVVVVVGVVVVVVLRRDNLVQFHPYWQIVSTKPGYDSDGFVEILSTHSPKIRFPGYESEFLNNGYP